MPEDAVRAFLSEPGRRAGGQNRYTVDTFNIEAPGAHCEWRGYHNTATKAVQYHTGRTRPFCDDHLEQGQNARARTDRPEDQAGLKKPPAFLPWSGHEEAYVDEEERLKAQAQAE